MFLASHNIYTIQLFTHQETKITTTTASASTIINNEAQRSDDVLFSTKTSVETQTGATECCLG